MPPPVTSYSSARYLQRFQCIGAACEDDCCHGWQVPVDEPHYRALRSAMEGSRAERERFHASHRRNRGDGSPTNYAFVVLDATGRCSMLDDDRLCATQRKYGAERLSNTCALYPREPALVGTRLELQAALSCPEVARQCLLYEDALDPVELDASAFQRPHLRWAMPESPPEPYRRVFDEVRDQLWRLLGAPHPLSSRLSFLALFAEETRGWLHRDAQEPCEERLGRARAAFGRPALASLHEELATIPDADEVGFSVVVRLLRRRIETTRTTPFHRLVEQALAGASDPRATLDEYRAQRAFWRARQGRRIDGYLLNYAAHHLAKEWYTEAPDLVAYVVGLLTRVAVLRFVLHMHPSVRAAAAAESVEAQTSALDAAVVEIVYKLTRAVEHDRAFRTAIESIAVEAGVTSGAHAALLARF